MRIFATGGNLLKPSDVGRSDRWIVTVTRLANRDSEDGLLWDLPGDGLIQLREKSRLLSTSEVGGGLT
jgi:hypothetical protein